MSRLLIALLLLVPLTATATAAPRIVVSLPPLHSLVAGVAGKGNEPHLLLRGGASPHTFSLAPSDVRALARADLVVAADPSLEGFLARPLASVAADADRIWLTRTQGVRTVATRAGGQWQAQAHGEHDHDPERIDPHAWLDPRNAIALTRKLAARLARLDPGQAGRYQANADRQIAQLRRLDSELHERIAPVRERPYLVFHDAYHYFEARYGLRPIGAVAVDPGRPPGAHRIAELHDRIEQTQAHCLFAEPQFRPKIVQVIAQATGIRTATLDPLGSTLEPGVDLYPMLMRNLADRLVECLGEPASMDVDTR